MKNVIEILEHKITELQEKIKKIKKILRKKAKSDDWMRTKITQWAETDKGRIAEIRKAIKILKAQK